jgi:hypothetical protein
MWPSLKKWRFKRYHGAILRATETLGWTSVGEFEDAEGRPYTYTIGFSKNAASPELVISAILPDHTGLIFREAFRLIKAGELVVSEGAAWSDIAAGGDCIFRRVHPTQLTTHAFGSGFWWHETRSGSAQPLEMFQLVFPDAAGRPPWDPDCDRTSLAPQAAFYEPDTTPKV